MPLRTALGTRYDAAELPVALTRSLSMSELRRDPLNDRWVIIAENRAERPNEFSREVSAQPRIDCVFCPGNEHQTPETLLVRRPANWNGDPAAWRIRVISNRYPAVEQTASTAMRETALHWAGGGFGVHEVIVDTAEHVTSITESSEAEAAELFEVYRDRMPNCDSSSGASSSGSASPCA